MRVVSLVPSVTETLLALGLAPVACTRFCEQPGLATVGGTKNPDVEAIVALSPDLVVMNDEENRLEDAEALRRAGLAVHDMSPRTVDDVGPAVVALAGAVGRPPPDVFVGPRWPPAAPAATAAGEGAGSPRVRAFVGVWRRPWMTLSGDTYGSAVLSHLGLDNVYADDASRYPEVDLGEVARRRPALAVLPSEPYPFGERHVGEVAEALPGARVVLVDGRDLFWWGSRTPDALERLAGVLLAG